MPVTGSRHQHEAPPLASRSHRKIRASQFPATGLGLPRSSRTSPIDRVRRRYLLKVHCSLSPMLPFGPPDVVIACPLPAIRRSRSATLRQETLRAPRHAQPANALIVACPTGSKRAAHTSIAIKASAPNNPPQSPDIPAATPSAALRRSHDDGGPSGPSEQTASKGLDLLDRSRVSALPRGAKAVAACASAIASAPTSWLGRPPPQATQPAAPARRQIFIQAVRLQLENRARPLPSDRPHRTRRPRALRMSIRMASRCFLAAANFALAGLTEVSRKSSTPRCGRFVAPRVRHCIFSINFPQFSTNRSLNGAPKPPAPGIRPAGQRQGEHLRHRRRNHQR